MDTTLRHSRYSLCGIRGLQILALTLTIGIATLNAQTDSVEADAQNYTQLVMSHDQLVLKYNMKRISKAEIAELDRLKLKLDEARARYALDRVSRSVAAEYDKRVKELSVEVVAPAVKQWVADAFPEPKAVASVYPDELKRVAAMQVLATTLTGKLGQAQPAVEKVGRYEEAWTALNPSSRDDYSTRLNTIEQLMRNNPFKLEVLARFVPLYADEAEAAVGNDRHLGDIIDTKARVRYANIAVSLIILSLPVLVLIVGQRNDKRTMPPNPDRDYPFRLPASLETVAVWRNRYRVEFDCGRVEYKDVKKEVITETRSTEGQTHQYGPWTFKDADSFSKSTRVEYHYSYSLITPDGRTTRLQNWFPIEAGQLFSMVSSGNHVLVGYNHTTESFTSREQSIRKVNAFPGFLLWAASMIVAAGGFLSVQHLLITEELAQESLYRTMGQMLIFFTVPLAAIYVVIFRGFVQRIRRRQFEKTWDPQFRAFMLGLTEQVKHACGREERAQARLDKRMEQRGLKPRPKPGNPPIA